jgi:NIMA-interacting peptidyl-prolyl cis-trans isomerase 1
MVPYFFNTETRESTWVAPETLSDGEIKRLPGAEHLPRDRADEQSGGSRRPGQSETDGGPERSRAGDNREKVRASHLLVKHRGSRNPLNRNKVRFLPFMYSY